MRDKKKREGLKKPKKKTLEIKKKGIDKKNLRDIKKTWEIKKNPRKNLRDKKKTWGIKKNVRD